MCQTIERMYSKWYMCTDAAPGVQYFSSMDVLISSKHVMILGMDVLNMKVHKKPGSQIILYHG